ncbi:MAG: hypothetical protein WKF86_01135, partial [Acidimicrobiales bacterium]
MASPPLPDMIEVLDRTTGTDQLPGLRELARLWLAWAPAARRQAETEALALARPSLSLASVAAIGSTASTIARGAGSSLGQDVRGRLDGRPWSRGAALRHVQQVVRTGGPSYVKLGQFMSTAKGLL